MSQLHVYFTPSSAEERNKQLISTIETRGCGVTVNKSFDPGILFETEEDKLPVVFIALDEDLSAATKVLNTLFERQKFFQFPVIVNGKKIPEWAEKLEAAFPDLVWADSVQPFGEVTKSLQSVELSYRARSSTSVASKQKVSEVQKDEEPVGHLESLFRYTPPVDFTESKIGLNYALPKSRASFDAEREISNPAVREEFSKFTKAHSLRSFSHVRRVFTAGRAVQESTDLWKLAGGTIETAFTLYLSACDPKEQALITSNYLESSDDTRAALADRMFQSSSLIKDATGNEDAAKLVADAGEVLAYKKAPHDSEASDSASFLLGLDLMDRSCWSHGHWQPRWAKRVLNSIIDNEIPMLSQKTSWVILQIMVNAFENLHTVKNVMVKKVRDGFGEERVIPAPKSANGSGSKVPLSQLRPGMVVSEPVCTLDGTEILPKNFEIDSEIIVRLWNLAATRAINVPYITPESLRAVKAS